jgi:AcrR family transcriptional regulator
MSVTNLRGEANREDVLRRVTAALERLLADGAEFSDVTIEQLSSEAGIARSTFYVHFRDRRALLKQMAAVVLDELQEAAVPLFDQTDSASIEDIGAGVRAVVEAYRPHELLMRPILAAAHSDPEVRMTYELALARSATTCEAFIRAQARHGRTRPVPPRETAVALVRMIERTVTQEATGVSADRREQIADALAAIVWHAIFSD